MSYILDALRRADAERERGAIPGLHSQSFPPGDALDTRPGQPPWVWVLLGMCVVLLAAVLWLWLGAVDKPEPRAALTPLPVTPAELSAAPTIAPQAMAPAPAAAPVVPTAASAPTASAARPAPAADAEALKARPKPAPTAVAKAQRETRTSVAAEPVAELKAPPLSALPEPLRRELPALTVGGSVYAKTPANRILILNGQPFHEGDSPMSELVLEQIKLKSAVLKYKGQRFELSY